MAKPKVVKVGDSLKLTDLYHAGAYTSGDKVCFMLPLKKSKRRNRCWKFVKGTLHWSYNTYCECCGPEFDAYILKADGSKVVLVRNYSFLP